MYLKPPNWLYSNFIDTGENKDLVEYFWNYVPSNLGEATKYAAKRRNALGDAHDRLEQLKKAMKTQLRKWGILTSLVEENIVRMEHGVIEAGQQPMCLGGPSYILNKVACIWKLCEIGNSRKLVPLYYMADYDKVQNELLNMWVPSNSPKGLLISLPADTGLYGIPIYRMPTPPEAWFRETVEKIRENYGVLLRGVERSVREGKLLNLDHALTILRNTYYSSENVSEWSTKILGSLFNLEADLGVPILAFSMPETRHLFQPGYELLLSEPNRTRFIQGLNKAFEALKESGYQPQIGLRDEDYVPFFLECMNDSCNRRRIELKYHRELSSSRAYSEGKCPSCQEEYSFSFHADHPDLSEIVNWISPRVDSRQIIVNSVIPVLCHVGGPGETSYHAQVIPASRSLKIPFPIYIRYTRTFYGTPWNEKYSVDLNSEGQATLVNKDLFSALGRWVDARNAQDPQKLVDAHLDIEKNIKSTYGNLLQKSKDLDDEIASIRKRLSESGDRTTLLNHMQVKQRLHEKIDLYLSWAFGRFQPERFGQEVSYLWLDLATVSGVRDLLGVFLRQYNKHTPVSSMFFANL
jgi:hypothetical protein